MTAELWAAWTLIQRELVRFFRQRHRVIGALAQPTIFWVLFGQGMRGSMKVESAVSYQEYFFPGVVVMIVLFTAIFATISIIEDRREGFLQEVLVSPTRRSTIVLGKVVGGSLLALIQAWIFILLGLLVGMKLSLVSAALGTVFLLVVGIGLCSLGTIMAWGMDSIQGFHALMSVFLFPMWLLSGAFFPAKGASPWLAWIITLNPLTYAVAGLRQIFTIGQTSTMTDQPGLGWCMFITLLAAAALFLIASRRASHLR